MANKKGIAVSPDMFTTEQTTTTTEETAMNTTEQTPFAMPANFGSMSATEQAAWFMSQAKGLQDKAKKEEEEKANRQKTLFAEINQIIGESLPLDKMIEGKVSQILIKMVDGKAEIIVSNGHKVSGTGTGHTGGGGAKVDLPIGTEIKREYKGVIYTLTATEQGLAIQGPDGALIGTYRSLTAAAKAIVPGTGEINGKSWWKVA